METEKKIYDKQFYERNRNDAKLISVDIVLAEALKIIPPCESAVDFGCATGTWLKGLGKYGITDIRGYDGKWVDKSKLLIPKECFFESDFDKPIEIDRRFNLAVSIEVGEHLQESSAKSFVENITKSADFVLFSAAIPNQGGENHVNEQWPTYWNKLFNHFGYICVDSIRKKIWDNYDVIDFHRQNVLLFVNKNRIAEIDVPETDICLHNPPMSLVAPDSYLRLIRYKKLFSPLMPLKTMSRKLLGNKMYNKIKNSLGK
jgi:hypothetical protein